MLLGLQGVVLANISWELDLSSNPDGITLGSLLNLFIYKMGTLTEPTSVSGNSRGSIILILQSSLT